MSEIIEEPVCNVDDLQVNEKKLLPFGESKIILIRESENKFAAIGNVCSHYGAPLINGVVYNGYISCPWHGACFSIHTGDIEDFPGCDSIPVYDAYVKEGSVHVKALKSNIVKKRIKPLKSRNIVNRSTFVVVGGGPAGFQCAETLRQEGFDGRIVLVSVEDVPPYDRTKLSKSLTVNVEDILLRKEDYYKKAGIELILNTKCTKIDSKSRLVYLDNGSSLYYEKLFVATGSSPRKYPSIPENTKNIFYVRTYQDARNIANNSKDKNVALVGSSFIAMEVAAYLTGKCKSVSIISKSNVPFANTLGQTIGERIKNFYVSKNVKFFPISKANFVVEDNFLKKIQFEDIELETDICIVGIGSDPNSEFLKETDIKLKNSFIEVNDRFQTSVEDIYAGGDVVIFPNKVFDNTLMNIAHWQTAQSHGRQAAFAMLNKSTNCLSVPFFWSMVFGKGLRFSGTIQDPENSLIEGSLEELSFVSYYFDSNNHVIGVATMSNDPIAAAFAALLRNSQKLTKEQIQNEGAKWVEDILNY